MNHFILNEQLKPFLQEDIQFGDLTSEIIFSSSDKGTASIIAKADGILSGTAIISAVYALLDTEVQVNLLKTDGDTICRGGKIATVKGAISSILTGERVILNLLQHMSGIATNTQKSVDALNSPHTRICDTRKTTPGLRFFEKYAVTTGGGFNHRQSVNDAVMIKDNHIAFCGSITDAVEKVRHSTGPMVKIEVETESEAQVKEAVHAGCDVIMFDNCTPKEVANFQTLVPTSIITEASGGIMLENLHTYQHTGVDYISLGYLTHSVKALDISLVMEACKS